MFKVEANLKEIATRQLTQRRARKEGEPRRPVTTVHCKALHGLQFRATVEGHSFISDEGDEVGGHDAGPAPLRYFLAGIMMCHQVWCVKSSAVADVKLDRLEGEICGFIEAGGGDADKEVVDAATRRCPSFVSAARSIPIELTIAHNGQNLGVKTYDRRKK
jgi:hypothetical protein